MPVHAATSGVFKRLQKISCLPATDRVYQRQQRVLVQGLICDSKIVWSEASIPMSYN
jgi:hypothetical protein